MVNFINIFDNREKAILVWLVLVLILMLFSKSMRKSLLSLLKSFFVSKILFIFLSMLFYVSLIVLLLMKLNFWDFSMLKDSIIWFLGPAFILFVNFTKALKENHFFKKLFFKNLKFLLIIEFIFNTFVFSFFTELLMVPALFFIGAMIAVAGLKPEHNKVKNIFEILLSFIFVIMISLSISLMIGDFNNFLTLETLKNFLLPVLLTITLIPFIYGLTIFASYENVFTRMGFMVDDLEIRNYLKRKIISTCFFDLKKIRFASEVVPKYAFKSMTRKDAEDLISKLSNQ